MPRKLEATIEGVEAAIEGNGRVHYLDRNGVDHEWPSVADLAQDYWRYNALTGSAREADPMHAWSCIQELLTPTFGSPHVTAVAVVQALVDSATSDDELIMVGAHALEELLHADQAMQHLDDIDLRARQQPRFRRAVANAWLSDEVPPEAKRRLAAYETK